MLNGFLEVTREDGRVRGLRTTTGTAARRSADRVGYMLRQRGYAIIDAYTRLESGIPVRSYVRGRDGRIRAIRARDARGRILPSRTVGRTRVRTVVFANADGFTLTVRAFRKLPK